MLKWYIQLSNRIAKSRKGASMVEYALVLAGIAIVAIVAVNLIGTRLSTKANAVAGNLT